MIFLNQPLYKREGARIIDKLMGDPYTKLVLVGQRKPFSNGRVQHGFLKKKKKKEEEEGLKYFLLVLVWLCGRVYIFPGVEKKFPFCAESKGAKEGSIGLYTTSTSERERGLNG